MPAMLHLNRLLLPGWHAPTGVATPAVRSQCTKKRSASATLRGARQPVPIRGFHVDKMGGVRYSPPAPATPGTWTLATVIPIALALGGPMPIITRGNA
jgi:hypothetical protein